MGAFYFIVELMKKMRNNIPLLLVSNNKNRIFEISHLEATGMKGGNYFRLPETELIELPRGSKLFKLPNRIAIGYNSNTKSFVTVDKNLILYKKDEKYYAVGAFLPAAFTVTYNSSYLEVNKPKVLPLFSYAAVALYKGKFYVTAIRVDWQRRHDSRFINMSLVQHNIMKFKKVFAKNRLVRHLQNCALVYRCPGAQNFFLSKFEAPLPTSPFCNARCVGCISYQYRNSCPATQPRVNFIPSAEEVSEIALFHISKVKDPIVSFGQGCEGEPLVVADTIEKSIRLIRKKTNKGIVHLNTNASKPAILAKLFDVGLDSIRVSINSIREKYYIRYYEPKDYIFKDVLTSIKMAKKKHKFVSINYLTMPGFTDLKDEYIAFKKFIEKYHIDMIQWRNLNIDPMWYFRKLKVSVDYSKMLGIREVMHLLKKDFSNLMMGYFNPALSKIKRFIY